MQTGPLLDEAYIATGQVLHVFKQFPLTSIHPNAMPAAKASYCAGQQAPELFWKLHDWLFANQATWQGAQDGASQFRGQALALGVDANKYDACIGDAATEARIQRDLAEGVSLGIQGTPAFFVNDWFLSGAYPFEEFKDRIEKARQGVHPPPTPTPAPTPTPLPQGAQFYEPDPNRPGLTYDGSPTLGAADARIVMLLFEDFKNADAAKHVADVEPALKTKYVDTQQIRLVFKFFPDTAPRAAVAALCAAKQGKFWEFRGLLYQKQSEWKDDDAAMASYARSLGLDEKRFGECLKDEQVQLEIDTAYQFGQNEIGVPTVPSYLLLKLNVAGQAESGQGLPGAQTLDQVEQAIQMLLNPPTPAPTPVSISPEKLASLPVGVDADGNFYRGDPKASVRLVDFSDYG